MTRRQILLALLPPLFFGTGFTIAKPAVAHFPPLFMMLMVYGGIAIIMALTHRARLKTTWKAIAMISALSVTIQGAFLFWGLRGVPAAAANLILQIQVPMVIILDWLVMKERFDLRKTIGMLLAIAGVAVVIGLPKVPPPFLPSMMIVVSAFFWAAGQVLARKLSLDRGPGVLKANAFGSVPQLLLATMVIETGQFESVVSAGPLEWSMLAFVGIVGFYLAYMTWFSLLKQCRMDEVAPFILLMPVVGVVTAYVVLGEDIGVTQLLGGGIVLAGLMIVSGIGAGGGKQRPRH